jgi:hypothetical protein
MKDQKAINIFVRRDIGKYSADVYWRYKPLLKMMQRQYLSRQNVLEVGGGHMGLAWFYSGPILGLDVWDWGQKPAPNITFVKGSVFELPLADRSQDWVVSVDMLEHLPEEKRALAIGEMSRVCRGYLYLAYPTGDKTLKAESKYQEFYRKMFGQELSWLEEHSRFGLPRTATIVDRLGPEWSVRVESNINLSIWLWENKMQWLWRNYRTTKRVMSILTPLYLGITSLMNMKPSYRQVVIARRK